MSSAVLGSVSSEHGSSRIPGDFDADEDDASYSASNEQDTSDRLSSLFPGPHDPSSLLQQQDENSGIFHPPNDTALEEHEMNKKLMDVESSFLPEFSHLAATSGQRAGLDDTYLFGVPNDNLARRKKPLSLDLGHTFRDASSTSQAQSYSQQSPRTPPETYKTPAPEEQLIRRRSDSQLNTPELPNTSALENMSSSPTAARTVSRVQSMATIGGYETADERDFAESPIKRHQPIFDETEDTPRRHGKSHTADTASLGVSTAGDGQSEFTGIQKRPNYLKHRASQNRLSYDSIASSNTDASDATLGADFALQSGGALPEPRLQRKGRLPLSRQGSLGSLMSAGSDDEGRSQRPSNAPDLSTLEEESPRSNRTGSRSSAGPHTPRAVAGFAMPTDTIIANNVRDIEVPGTFARQYRQERSMSPSKSLSMTTTPGPKRGLTLKEHRSTVEKLGKENFDLKMKIHFLDQALQKRSEDGIKEMITENVQLKSDRLRLEKEAHHFRKQIRELQRKLQESGVRESPGADQGYGTDEERSPTAEEELIYLRERIETNEYEIEKLRHENVAKETEKRRLAEMVRAMGDTRAGTSDVGSREERDMWKDMLEAETIAREQSEEENKKLRDEVSRLRQETFGVGRSYSKRSRVNGSIVSQSSSVDATNAQSAELERLRHEVSELQKMIGAQASTLTSRNKEKERLYQEIEDLKIGRMSGLRSIAGDSILDRSASRARSISRASNGTRMSRLSDPEREVFEAKIDELRDEVSQFKLRNQELATQFDEALAELDAVDAQAQADADQFNEELMLLTQERDNALRDAEEQDTAFQQLKNEAQEEIDGLGDELDAKVDECAKLEQQLGAQADQVKALQSEMRSAGEGLMRLEQDAQNNLARYQEVKSELDESNRELESMEKNLAEAESKMQRLTVQQESSRNEIAFLREEQDGDKIKIGDLESLLKKVHLNLDTERDKARDFERRLGDERQQREVVSSQEKQDVQKMINDLNREATNAKEELRRARKALSTREIEANTHKERLGEIEESLRHVLGNPDGNRTTLISAVTKIQRELDQSSVDLDATRRRLDERETLLQNRDQLLESSALEYRKLNEALDKERTARRQDKHSFEQALKSHQQSTRALTASGLRIAELEQGRNTDRKRLTQLETQYKEQLAERNQVLLTIWKKLSAMCGPDWAHNNSLINGNLPSQEVIGNMLFWPGFSRNLLLASKQVENTLSTFRDKIKTVERELWKEYQTLEHTLEIRTKKLERIEESWEKMKARQLEHESQMSQGGRMTKAGRTPPDLNKLKGENRLLKAELQLLQQQQQQQTQRLRSQRGDSRPGTTYTIDNQAALALDGMMHTANGIPARSSSVRRGSYNALQRAHTTTGIDSMTSSNNANSAESVRTNSVASSRASAFLHQDSRGGLMIPAGPFDAPVNGNFSIPPRDPSTASGSDIASMHTTDSGGNNRNHNGAGGTGGSGQEKWIHRLRELERRLKAEREARLLDRSGMRRRLEERDAVNEELRMELERERIRRSVDTTSTAAASTNRNSHYRQQSNAFRAGEATPVDFRGSDDGDDHDGDRDADDGYHDENMDTPRRQAF